MTDPKYLGQTGTVAIEADEIDTFERPKNVTSVTLETDEVTSICPVTGQPDWYVVSVQYNPDERCIESKAFKLYMWSFREKGLYGEAFASEIADAIFDAVKPYYVNVKVVQKPRGGIAIESVAERDRD